MSELEELRAVLRVQFASGAVSFDPAVQSQPHLDSLTGPLWLGSHDCGMLHSDVWITLWAEFVHWRRTDAREWVATWCMETNDMPEGLGQAISYCPFCGAELLVRKPVEASA